MVKCFKINISSYLQNNTLRKKYSRTGAGAIPYNEKLTDLDLQVLNFLGMEPVSVIPSLRATPLRRVNEELIAEATNNIVTRPPTPAPVQSPVSSQPPATSRSNNPEDTIQRSTSSYSHGNVVPSDPLDNVPTSDTSCCDHYVRLSSRQDTFAVPLNESTNDLPDIDPVLQYVRRRQNPPQRHTLRQNIEPSTTTGDDSVMKISSPDPASQLQLGLLDKQPTVWVNIMFYLVCNKNLSYFLFLSWYSSAGCQ